MKAFDRYLQQRRIDKVRPYVGEGMRLLDIGCADGVIFRAIPSIVDGVGIDPDMEGTAKEGSALLVKGYFPRDLPDQRPFDVITMLAVLEHIPENLQTQLAADCAKYLKPGGHLVITVPSPQTDYVIAVLMFLRVMDSSVGRGQTFHQHYGFESKKTPSIFGGAGLELVKAKKFQLGFNNLFVFKKPT